MKTKKDTNTNALSGRSDWCLMVSLLSYSVWCRMFSALIVYRTAGGLSRFVQDSIGAAGDRRCASQEGTSCSEWNNAKMTARWRWRSFRVHTGDTLYRSAPLPGGLPFVSLAAFPADLSRWRVGYIFGKGTSAFYWLTVSAGHCVYSLYNSHKEIII